MSGAPPLSDDLLQAYADGQLSGQAADEFALALERAPGLAAQVAEIRRQNLRLREALDLWLAEPLPHNLLAAAARQGPVHRRGAGRRRQSRRASGG